MFDAEDQYWTKFEKDGDAAAFARQWAAFARVSVFPVLLNALEGSPQDERRDQFVERLESGLRERLSVGPRRVRIPLAKLLLDKRSWPR
jgi:hypothetical protein